MRWDWTPETVSFWLPIAVAVVLIMALLARLVIRAHSRKVETGREGLIGEQGTYSGDGKVLVHGELWHAAGNGGLSEGDKVVVESIERMTLRVRKL